MINEKQKEGLKIERKEKNAKNIMYRASSSCFFTVYTRWTNVELMMTSHLEKRVAITSKHKKTRISMCLYTLEMKND